MFGIPVLFRTLTHSHSSKKEGTHTVTRKDKIQSLQEYKYNNYGYGSHCQN